jgi:hypothetical protein
MTLNRLHKILGRLIEQGHGRRSVAVDKQSFQDPRENDGPMMLQVCAVDVQWINDADDDGGTAINKDGTERGRTTVILGGCAYDRPAKGESSSHE